MNLYSYNGPVMEFDRVVEHFWKAETVAQSERKARSNLTYQWKMKNGRARNTKISLPGQIKIVN